MDIFWQNTIWYIVLGITSVFSLFVIFIKAENRKFTFAFWISVLGVTYMLEMILLFFLNAYSYHPEIVSNSFQDSIIGNFFSQFSVSSTAVLICVLGLRKYWNIGFSIVYFLIDLFYSHIGVYEHLWYQSIYTLFGFIIYSLLIKRWYQLMLDGKAHKWLYLSSLFSGVFAGAGNSIITTFNLLNFQVFKPSICAEYTKNHLFGALLYGPVLIIILITLQRYKIHWVLKVLFLFTLGVVQYGLHAIGFIRIKEGYFLIITAIDILGYYGWVVLINRFLHSRNQAKANSNPSTCII